jgi:UDP-N-acetylglucosamine 2-epimerase (non-hydrolysing)
MNVLIVVGARPNFMKVAPIIAAIQRHNQEAETESGQNPWLADTIEHILVHTGQHYDALMSEAFFKDLGLPKADVDLGVGSGSHAVQTAEIMRKFEPVLLSEKPDAVLVVGDVNSTLACALVTAKISFDTAGSKPLIAHVEAGLRSFDRSMPEEINRILTDQMSDLLFVSEESALRNLRDEGVPFHKIHFVGNTMIDSLLAFKEKAESSAILDNLRLRGNGGNPGSGNSVHPYALLTLHRPSNVDDQGTLSAILEGLEEIAKTQPIVFPAHPRTRRRLEQFGSELRIGSSSMASHAETDVSGANQCGIILTEPMGYLDFLCLMKHATLVVTDSGGVQEETTCIRIPCVTVRENTERPVTVENGTNVIAGTSKESIRHAIRQQIARKNFPQSLPANWDGQAAARIIAALARAHDEAAQAERSVASRLTPNSLGPQEPGLS